MKQETLQEIWTAMKTISSHIKITSQVHNTRIWTIFHVSILHKVKYFSDLTCSSKQIPKKVGNFFSSWVIVSSSRTLLCWLLFNLVDISDRQTRMRTHTEHSWLSMRVERKRCTNN
jgi:hypothetical protein